MYNCCLFDKNNIKKICMYLYKGYKEPVCYTYKEKGVETIVERKWIESSLFRNGRYEDVVVKKDREAGWYYNHSHYNNTPFKSLKDIIDKFFNEHSHYIKDNTIYKKIELQIFICDHDNKKTTIKEYYYHTDKAKSRIDSIKAKFKNLIVL